MDFCYCSWSLPFFSSSLVLLPPWILSFFSPNAIAPIQYALWSLSITFGFDINYDRRWFLNLQVELLHSVDDSRDELDFALEKAAMANKTVVIAVINKAYADQGVKDDTTMLDVFLSSFWMGEDTRRLLDHLLLVAVDQTSYDRCRFQRLNCFKLETEGVDFGGEKLYMSDEFNKMMWRRTLFLLDVLKRGYSFIFTVNNPSSLISSSSSSSSLVDYR